MSSEVIHGPEGIRLVNAEAQAISGDGARRPPTIDVLLRSDLPIRSLLIAAVPGLSEEFLDSAERFEEHTSGQEVMAKLRGLVAGGISAGNPPTLELRLASGPEYSIEVRGDRIVVLVPGERACKDDPPLEA